MLPQRALFSSLEQWRQRVEVGTAEIHTRLTIDEWVLADSEDGACGATWKAAPMGGQVDQRDLTIVGRGAQHHPEMVPEVQPNDRLARVHPATTWLWRMARIPSTSDAMSWISSLDLPASSRMIRTSIGNEEPSGSFHSGNDWVKRTSAH